MPCLASRPATAMCWCSSPASRRSSLNALLGLSSCDQGQTPCTPWLYAGLNALLGLSSCDSALCNLLKPLHLPPLRRGSRSFVRRKPLGASLSTLRRDCKSFGSAPLRARRGCRDWARSHNSLFSRGLRLVSRRRGRPAGRPYRERNLTGIGGLARGEFSLPLSSPSHSSSPQNPFHHHEPTLLAHQPPPGGFDGFGEGLEVEAGEGGGDGECGR
jgi:hypothetical protein